MNSLVIQSKITKLADEYRVRFDDYLLSRFTVQEADQVYCDVQGVCYYAAKRNLDELMAFVKKEIGKCL